MTLDSYSSLATKNYISIFMPPGKWNLRASSFCQCLSAILCLSICGKKLTLEPKEVETSYLAYCIFKS